jgi:hypothetical protein
LQDGADALELKNNVAFSQIPRTRSEHSAVSRIRALPAAKPLPGILREQDRPAGIHDNAWGSANYFMK